MALTKEFFKDKVCDNPECKCGGNEFYLHSSCHTSSPTWTLWKNGLLIVICAECGNEIASFELATGKPALDDSAILELYSAWSEEFWCAGFMSPDEDNVRNFREWLTSPRQGRGERNEPFADYELKMLEIYKRQEKLESN